MRASIVIPTFNRLGDLRRVLAAVRSQVVSDGSSFEIVVVDDGSSDDTWQWLINQPKRDLVIRRQENAGPARARNQGVEAARGEIVLFLGDDTIPAPGWLAEHLEYHGLMDTGPLAVLGYTSFPRDQDSAFLRWINEFGAQFGYLLIENPENVPFNFFYTSNISLSRQTFKEHGGFREDFPAAAWEDIEFAYRATRAGMRIVYQPRARTVHHHRIRPGTFCRRQRTAGRSAAIFAELHPELRDFLGVNRLDHERPGPPAVRLFLRALVSLGDKIPGLIPGRVTKKLLDMAYLEGLAEGLHSQGRR